VIPARKRRWAEWLVTHYIDYKIKRHFAAVRIHGLVELRARTAQAPVLLAANHTAWWDSMFFLHLANLGIGIDTYALMDASNLVRLPILGAIGAFGVTLGDKADGERAVAYAAHLLDRPERAIVIFPQGRERPSSERPLRFHPGASRIAALARGALVVPCALRYEHRSRPRPEAFIACGEPCSAEPEILAAAVTLELDRIDRALGDGSIDTWSSYV